MHTLIKAQDTRGSSVKKVDVGVIQYVTALTVFLK